MAKSNVKKEEVQEVKKHITLTGEQVIIGKGGNLKTDKEYVVTGKIATILINKGFAILKTK